MRRLFSSRTARALLLVSLMLVATASAGVGGAHSPAGAPAARASGASSTLRVSGTPSPSAGNLTNSTSYVNGTFFSTNPNFTPAINSSVCEHLNNYFNSSYEQEYEHYRYCYGGPQSPTTLALGGSTVGVGYSFISNQSTTSKCLGPNETIVSSVAFQVSNDGGQTYGAPVWIANATCRYVQSIEPSFALSTTGTIYGVFIEENVSSLTFAHNATSNSATNNSSEPTYPFSYYNRTNDGIGFTSSTDNGATFANVTTIPVSGQSNLADPKVAAFGDTVYVLYQNISAGTSPLPNEYSTPNASYPMSLNVVYSTDGGSSWNGPYVLPTLPGSAGNTSEGGAIAVNSVGTVAVSYDTNRTCFLLYSFCYAYGGEVVVTTSTTNGTSWGPLRMVGTFAGELPNSFFYRSLPWINNFGFSFPSEFELMGFDWGPTTSVAWDPLNPAVVYVVWVGSYYTWSSNSTSSGGEGGGGGQVYVGYGSALFDAVSTNGGTNWTQSTVEEPEIWQSDDFDVVFQPGLTVSPTTGEVYVSYTRLNETYCSGCTDPLFQDHPSYWLADSFNGITWVDYPVATSYQYSYQVTDSYTGGISGVAVTSAGPVAVYSEALPPISSNYFAENSTTVPPTYYEFENESYTTTLISAFPNIGGTVAVNFTEAGLPSNTSWEIDLSGNQFTVNTTTVQVGNVPLGATIDFNAPPVLGVAGGWSEMVPVATIGVDALFFAPQTVWLNYSLWYGFAIQSSQIAAQPTSTSSYLDLFFDFSLYTPNGNFYYNWYANYNAGAGWQNGTATNSPFPWYLPASTTVPLGFNYGASIPVSYIFGSGNGSYTGLPTNSLMTLNGPINESFFLGALGIYSLSVAESGLPNGVSYSFTFDGTPYSAVAPATVTLPNVFTGAYSLTNVTATSTTAGWEYFGSYPSGYVDVPLATHISLNFTTYVDVGAPAGQVTFHALGLATGDFWQFVFNGTTYGSTSPWFNLTEHPGTYLVEALPVADSANDSVAYVPNGFGPSLSVTTGSTYTISYSVAYRVQVAGSVGGTVTDVGNHWVAPGTPISSLATPGANYNFLGWTGTGTGAYSGPSPYANFTVRAPITETASFQPLPTDRFNLTLTESGLPSGTPWSVDLNHTGYASNASSFVIPNLYPCTAGAEGQYLLSVPWVYLTGVNGVQYRSSGYPSTTCTNGATDVKIQFVPWYLVSPYISGAGNVSVNGVQSTLPIWVAGGSSVSLSAAPANLYVFDGWEGTGPGNYTGANPIVTVDPTGPVTELAMFSPEYIPPPTTYNLVFHVATPFVAGTSWTVALNGTPYTSTNPWINFTGESPGPHTLTVSNAFSPDRSVKYVPKNPPPAVDLTGNKSFELSYTSWYQVTISTGPGGTVSPGAGSAYYVGGSTLELVATPNAGYTFVGWAGTGGPSYTGPLAIYNATVNAPFSDVAAFAPSSSGSSSSGSWITSPAGIAVLAVVGLLVGVGAGYALFGRGRSGRGGASGGGGA
jgi:hypothetical protein